MDIRDEIEVLKTEIHILKTGYAAIFGGSLIDLRGTGIAYDHLIPNPEIWISERELEIKDLEYKLEVLRLCENIIKTFPKLFPSDPVKDYEYHIAQDANNILKMAQKIRNNTIGD